MRLRWWFPLGMFLLGSTAYLAASRVTFTAPVVAPASMTIPATAGGTDSNDCGFFPADFTAEGGLRLTPGQAWWTSVLRKQEYWSALSLGSIVAFLGFAVRTIRQMGGGMASGLCAGGGLLALLTLCLGCLAPLLSVLGLGLVANLGLGQFLPKWLMTLHTVGLTVGGMVFLARRARRCPLSPHAAGTPALEQHVNPGVATMEH